MSIIFPQNMTVSPLWNRRQLAIRCLRNISQGVAAREPLRWEVDCCQAKPEEVPL